MLPVQRVKGQPQLWQMSGEPPPWVWMIPASSGLCRVGSPAPPPLLISSRPPPLLQAVSSWQLSCDPFLPLMRAAEPAINQFPVPNVQWDLPSRPHVLGFQPSTSVELVPVFPQVYRTVLPPHFGKGWVEKRVPDYKVYLNNTLETSWFAPEDIGLFQRQDKPLLMTNQMAMSISRPATASRNMHTLLVSPRRISGYPLAIKRVGSNKRMALAAAAMMAMESDVSQGPSSSSAHPIHLLSLLPINLPYLSTPNLGARSAWEGLLEPVVPARGRVTTLSTPSVTLITSDWKDQTPADKKLDMKKPSCSGALVLRSEPNPEEKNEEEPFKIGMEGSEGTPKDKRPVASTPVPGSPWCVVWTGDDRVFFFNPTMQLSVWEKPVDLKDRGDLNRIIEDPPHKRKKDSLKDGLNSPMADDDDDDEDEHSSKTKRNKLEDSAECAVSSEDKDKEKSVEPSPHRMVLPLELRIAHFRSMLLERGVSAFSTWEKELHKIVFDPRYLLLSSEERKQIFDQFVKARMKEEYKENKSKLQQAKEEFRKLLEESKITSRSTFKEFSEKYGRDQRFKQVPKRKDQEMLFNQFISSLKKRDKENRVRLRKMR